MFDVFSLQVIWFMELKKQKNIFFLNKNLAQSLKRKIEKSTESIKYLKHKADFLSVLKEIRSSPQSM